MHIEHLAIWVRDIEAMKDFYVEHFKASAGKFYHNPINEFQSYFLQFEKGPRLELMHMQGIPETTNNIYAQFTGLIHFAISVGNKETVDAMTENLRNKGIKVIGEPRWTGDGYYESVVLDPENNRIEITI